MKKNSTMRIAAVLMVLTLMTSCFVGGTFAKYTTADDASDNTKKEFKNMCGFYHVPIFFYGTKEELGHAMGKEMRASLAVTDEGFSKSLMKLLSVTEVVK